VAFHVVPPAEDFGQRVVDPVVEVVGIVVGGLTAQPEPDRPTVLGGRQQGGL